jgi:hypothetical protein
MKKTSKSPPIFDELGRPNTKRFLVRDLSETDCSDWVADVWPERQTVDCKGFPFRLARRWDLAEATATIGALAVADCLSETDAFARWSREQTQILSQRDGHPVKMAVIDELHFDSKRNLWWKSEDASHLHHVFRALRGHEAESWRALNAQLITFGFEPPYLNSLRAKPVATGMSLKASEVSDSDISQSLIERCHRNARRARGYWNLQHTLLPVSEFVRVLGLDDSITETAGEIAGDSSGINAPLAHTLLIRAPQEWVGPLLQRTKWTNDEIFARVQQLRDVLAEAGVRPITDQPPPLVPKETPLQLFAELVGPRLVNPDQVRLLFRGGIDTVGDLVETPPVRLLEHAPIMPSGLRGFVRALGAVGYQYPYVESDLTQ